MTRKAKLKAPLDCSGVKLKVTDLVESTPDYDDKPHYGEVIKIELISLVNVKHREGCCVHPGNPSRVWRSSSRLWKRVR